MNISKLKKSSMKGNIVYDSNFMTLEEAKR
jgi:hypothetical protein